jgi:hypothetical protein
MKPFFQKHAARTEVRLRLFLKKPVIFDDVLF